MCVTPSHIACLAPTDSIKMGKVSTIWTASQTVLSAVLDCCLTSSSFNVSSFVVDANLSQAFWKGQWKTLLGSGHGGAAQPRDLQSWVHFVDMRCLSRQTQTSGGCIYRGRISFAGGNGRRSVAISAGKSFTTAVQSH